MKQARLLMACGSVCGSICVAHSHAAQGATPITPPGSVVIYGRIGVLTESVRAHGLGSVQRLSATRSVLGFRGGEDLGGGLSAIFQVEGAVATDTGTGSLANRDTRIGLQGTWGTLFVGHWLTPYVLSTAGLDPFVALPVGFSNVMGNGAAPSTDNTGNLSSFDRRQANVVQYHTPNWQGWTTLLAMTPREERERRSGLDPWLVSAALIHEDGPWTTSIAWERHSDYQAAGTRDDGFKMGVAWRHGPWRVSALVERLRFGTAQGALSRDAWFISASHSTGAGRWVVNFAKAGAGRGPDGVRVGAVVGGANTGGSQTTAGYEYMLSRRTFVFAYAARLRNEAAGRLDLTLGPLGLPAGSALSTAAIGIRTTF